LLVEGRLRAAGVAHGLSFLVGEAAFPSLESSKMILMAHCSKAEQWAGGMKEMLKIAAWMALLAAALCRSLEFEPVFYAFVLLSSLLIVLLRT
jgi:hypothetical protein